MKSKLNKLFLPVVTIFLLHTVIAFGSGVRFLGVQVVNHEQGVIIQNIVQNSPATRVVDTSSGQYVYLEPGDVIQVVNGVKVTTPEQFVQLIRMSPPVAVIRVLDIRNRIYLDVAAMVGSSDEVAAYFNQSSPSLKDKSIPYVSPETPYKPESMSIAQRKIKIQELENRISILNRKIRDQERSIQKYEDWGNDRPGISNMMLQQSARNLLQTYEKQKMELTKQKAQLEAGM